MRALVCVALAVLGLARVAAAQGAAEDPLVAAARLVVADDEAALVALPETPAEGQPVVDRATDEVRAPGEGGAILALIVPEGSVAPYRVRGYLDLAGSQLYLRVAGVAPAADTWRGPHPVAVVTLAQVRRELERHTTDSGEQGFYAGRFAKLREHCGSQAIAHLLVVAGSTVPEDRQLSQLAVEALGQLGYARALPGLVRMSKEGWPTSTQERIAVSIALLGRRDEFDAIVARYDAVATNTGSAAALRGRAHSAVALMLSQIHKHDEALERYFKAAELAPDDAMAHYNLACSYAILKRPEEAFKHLGISIDKGYDHWEWLRLDGDLSSLRADPRWKAVLARQYAAQPGSGSGSDAPPSGSGSGAPPSGSGSDAPGSAPGHHR